MTLTYRNGVSIGEIVVYVPCLLIAIYLAIRHGFNRNSGWLFLIIFCLSRILGPILQLLTISSPNNTSLYIGSAILNSVGVSPLELASLGLLSRLLESIHKTQQTFLRRIMLQAVQIVIVVAFILGIEGGVKAGGRFSDSLKTGGTAQYHPGTLNKAATILLIVCYLAIVLFTAVIAIFVKHAETGEKRLFVAVALALPFLGVRIVYSALSTFSTDTKFNILVGDTTIFLCVALIEELVVIVIYEGMGLTLHKQVKPAYGRAEERRPEVGSANTHQQVPPKHSNPDQENVVLRIARKTLIGRLVTSVAGKRGGDRDVEMQRSGY